MLWFRHGLRLHDNPSLHVALEDRSAPFFPMFIFDGETAGKLVIWTLSYGLTARPVNFCCIIAIFVEEFTITMF